jgi:hypothetical protein
VDRFAFDSFERALAAQASGFLAGEIVPVVNEEFKLDGYNTRGIKLPRKVESAAVDTHIRPSPLEILAKLRPAFGGVQTGGNSSAIVDGAAAALVASGKYVKASKLKPLGRIVGVSVAGCPPENMGYGPVSASRPLLEKAGLTVDAIDRWEINEAFAAQCLACERELGIDHARLNVNGGAIAIGHPLGATGVRLAVTVARELKRSGKRYGIATACIGGGQGIAMQLGARCPHGARRSLHGSIRSHWGQGCPRMPYLLPVRRAQGLRSSTAAAGPSARCCTGWCSGTCRAGWPSRASAIRTACQCPRTSSGSCAGISPAAFWRTALPVPDAVAVVTISCSPSPARVGACVPPAPRDAWPRRPRT